MTDARDFELDHPAIVVEEWQPEPRKHWKTGELESVPRMWRLQVSEGWHVRRTDPTAPHYAHCVAGVLITADEDKIDRAVRAARREIGDSGDWDSGDLLVSLLPAPKTRKVWKVGADGVAR